MSNFIHLAFFKLFFLLKTLSFLIAGVIGYKIHEKYLCGELIVAGKHHANIELLKHPKHIQVYFKDDACVPCNIPCNPLPDSLEYKLTRRRGKYILEIFWNVSQVRAIEWKVRY
jgi:hypothetical protein